MIYCPNCGAQLAPGAGFCPRCGAAAPSAPVRPPV
ncbi:MAG: zinc-ribbon domain-containing protein, partial [Oscillospiraceae bacterium]|nr:zinc-ribbon domain-containing protein [Oscillospiraceae bacterium]